MIYRVDHTAALRNHIAAQLEYLQGRHVSPERIDNWFERLYEAIDGLSEWPARFPVAEAESKSRGMEIRKMNFGDYLIFYTIHEETKVVEVLGMRHGARLR